MSISFNTFRNPVQLTTTKTSAVKTSIEANKYIGDVFGSIKVVRNKLAAENYSIASDAHRVWGNKIQKICPKYTYKIPFEGLSWKQEDLPSSCTDAKRMIIVGEDDDLQSKVGGVFCSTEANDQDKKECHEKISAIPLPGTSNKVWKIPLNVFPVYTATQKRKLRDNYSNDLFLSRIKGNFDYLDSSLYREVIDLTCQKGGKRKE